MAKEYPYARLGELVLYKKPLHGNTQVMVVNTRLPGPGRYILQANLTDKELEELALLLTSLVDPNYIASRFRLINNDD